MESTFITILNYSSLVELILNSQERIIYSAINTHQEVAEVLKEAAHKDVQVTVIIDPSEDNYRNGFGEIKSIDILQKSGVNIYEVPGNRLSLLIADNIGYIFFPQSKIFEEEPVGPNAILMNPMMIIEVVTHYFPAKSDQKKKEYIEALNCAVEAMKNEFPTVLNNIKNNYTDLSVRELDQEKLKEVKENLANNPPVHPDIKRKINTYTAKVQFVELKFLGSNFKTTKVNIPKDALPFKDANIKNSLETKLNLFTNVKNNEDIAKFEAINQKVEMLRFHPKTENKDYFITPITCRNKSIIKVSRKGEFLYKIEAIGKEIDEFRKETLENLEEELLNRKETIKKELKEFLEENPPKEFQKYSGNLFPRKIEDLVQTLVSQVNFPNLGDLLSGLALQYNFYDLTIEDFRDPKLIEEFKNKGILNSDELDDIVSFNKAFEVAK